jgi:ribosomal protein L24
MKIGDSVQVMNGESKGLTGVVIQRTTDFLDICVVRLHDNPVPVAFLTADLQVVENN